MYNRQLKNKTSVFIRALIAIIVILFMFWLFRSLSNNKFDPAEQSLDTHSGVILPGQLLSMNGSGQTGRIYSSIQNDKVLVLVEILSKLSDDPQPVYIHQGTCQNLGVAKYQMPDVQNGRTQSTSAVSAQQIQNMGDLAVVVLNTQDQDKADSCGNLSEIVFAR